MRVNTFRNIIDLMDDIFRRDGQVPLFEIMHGESPEDRYMIEGDLYTYYFSIRYPHFAQKLKESEELRQRLFSDGFALTVPQNFEGDMLDLAVKIPVHANPEKIVHRLSRIDENLIRTLQGLLK